MVPCFVQVQNVAQQNVSWQSTSHDSAGMLPHLLRGDVEKVFLQQVLHGEELYNAFTWPNLGEQAHTVHTIFEVCKAILFLFRTLVLRKT